MKPLHRNQSGISTDAQAMSLGSIIQTSGQKCFGQRGMTATDGGINRKLFWWRPQCRTSVSPLIAMRRSRRCTVLTLDVCGTSGRTDAAAAGCRSIVRLVLLSDQPDLGNLTAAFVNQFPLQIQRAVGSGGLWDAEFDRPWIRWLWKRAVDLVGLVGK
jgi:hypothetical protein